MENANSLKRRKNIRLKGYDYSQNGMYFVTICCQHRKHCFGDIINGEMKINDVGKIAQNCWLEIPQHFPNIVLQEFVIMPNHIHGIILIDNSNERANNYSPLQGTSKTIGSIIRGFKIGVTKQMGKPIWQRNFYEHIIRGEKDYLKIAEYIFNNPINWNTDELNEKIVGANNHSPK